MPFISLARKDWQIWTAAIMTSTSARDLFISSVRKYVMDGLNSQPLGDWYETINGDVEGFRARPVVGGHFALVRFSDNAINSLLLTVPLAFSLRCELF
jgi:hypothetical protein